MNNLRKHWGLLVAVAFIVLLGVLATCALQWGARECDPKYIPLIGSCITGITTLISIAIAAGGLLVAYRNIMNPFRLELHKSQTAAICELVELAVTCNQRLARWEYERSQETIDKNSKDYFASINALMTKQSEKGILLNAEVNEAVAKFLDCCRKFVAKIRGDYRRVNDLTSDTIQFRRDFATFVNTCRDALHIARLTEETARLLASPKETSA